MKTSRICVAVSVLFVLVAGLAATSSAVPVFARKYGFSCTMCHSNAPRLNDFGTRYRANGYRLPGREKDEKTVLESPAPIAFRTSAGYTYEKMVDQDAENTNGFRVSGLDFLSAGLLGEKIGYMMIYTPQIEPSRYVDGQAGALEMANVVFSGVGSPALAVRAGRFEPAYAAFSVKRRLSISPYDVYDYGAPGGVVFSETQTGLELTGHGRGWNCAAGWLGGSETNEPDDFPADAYARAAVVIGPGEGQTAGQRLGVTGYFGSARPYTFGSDERESFYRVGVDASLNYSVVNLALQYLYGKDDKTLWGYTEDPDFWGGFAEITIMPSTKFVAFGRFDMVTPPDSAGYDDEMRFTAGARYYFVNNLALHLEYTRLQTNATAAEVPDPVSDTAWARLDVIF